tara:strand:+ start:1107 stop:1766 length:660 start_codon:yes stop_codon:yes gene_type:complete
MKTIIVHCIKKIQSGTSFGINTDDGERVFIPAHIAGSIKLQEGETFECHLTENEHEGGNTPWRVTTLAGASSLKALNRDPLAMSVSKAKPMDAEPVLDLDDEVKNDAERAEKRRAVMTIQSRILDVIKAAGGFASTGHINREMGGDMRCELTSMHLACKLSLGQVHNSPNQQRASARIWALDAGDFDRAFSKLQSLERIREGQRLKIDQLEEEIKALKG